MIDNNQKEDGVIKKGKLNPSNLLPRESKKIEVIDSLGEKKIGYYNEDQHGFLTVTMNVIYNVLFGVQLLLKLLCVITVVCLLVDYQNVPILITGIFAFFLIGIIDGVLETLPIEWNKEYIKSWRYIWKTKSKTE